MASNNLPKYVFNRPARIPFTRRTLLQYVRDRGKAFAHLVGHIFSIFDRAPSATFPLTMSEPRGQVTAEMLAVCQILNADSESRLAKLESKATGLLSVIVVAFPLAAAVAVFIRENDTSAAMANVTLSLSLTAMSCLFVSVVAALRGVAVRDGSALFLNAVIDPAVDEVRSYSDDFLGRGLLSEAASRQAVCDHIADFVRGAQLFLVLGILFTAAAAVPALFNVQDEQPMMQGSLSIDLDSLRAIQGTLVAGVSQFEARMNQLERELLAIKAGSPDREIKLEVERLSKDLADLRRSIEPTPAVTR